MGLASVYGTIKQHNGIITVDSVPGKGTKFFIYLPLAGEEMEEETTPDIFAGSKESLQVLLADDENSVRGLISDVLKGLGHSVLSCTNGREAADIYKQNGKILIL